MDAFYLLFIGNISRSVLLDMGWIAVVFLVKIGFYDMSACGWKYGVIKCFGNNEKEVWINGVYV